MIININTNINVFININNIKNVAMKSARPWHFSLPHITKNAKNCKFLSYFSNKISNLRFFTIFLKNSLKYLIIFIKNCKF